jgi:EAL domain-containing protein (putative c-di-GMP-specific phosphodiesterase class I)
MTSPAPAARSKPNIVESLKRERDRFVALAFCAADVLIEADKDCKISYAAGATMGVTGYSADQLVGDSLLKIVSPDDRPILRELIRGMAVGKRLQPVPVRLIGPKGLTPRLLLTGYVLPNLPDSLFFAIRPWTESNESDDKNPNARDKESGLYKTDAFLEQVAKRIDGARGHHENIEFTMLRLDNFAELGKDLDAKSRERLLKTIGACLRVSSGPNDTVARFDEENYGLVHAEGTDIDDLKDRIHGHLKAAGKAGLNVSVAAGTVSADIENVAERDLLQAMHYTIKEFCDSESATDAIGNLSENLDKHIAQASAKMSSFRDIVSEADFDIAFQPIIDLATGKIAHYEALARFGGGSDRSPYELITFAENTGLISEFDYAMAQKLLAWLSQAKKVGQHFRVALNLSGKSVSNPGFLKELQTLLAKHSEVRDQLIIEITESARIKDLKQTNAFIQVLRQAGHLVCLDDFGAGAAALRYLHDLDVDIVKIDGQYIQGALRGGKNKAFLKAIAGLCTELSVETVAEMVENEQSVAIIKECGIGFGQGYFFGRPSTEIGVFTKSPPKLR